MTLHRDWSRRLSFALATLVALSAALLSGAGLFGPVEDALTARRAELLSRPPTGEVAIVEVDARSLARLRTWPWPRSYHARTVPDLTAATQRSRRRFARRRTSSCRRSSKRRRIAPRTGK